MEDEGNKALKSNRSITVRSMSCPNSVRGGGVDMGSSQCIEDSDTGISFFDEQIARILEEALTVDPNDTYVFQELMQMQDRICGLRQAKVQWMAMKNSQLTSSSSSALSKSKKLYNSTETLESGECININDMIRQSQSSSVATAVRMDEEIDSDVVATIGGGGEFTNINDMLRAGGNDTGIVKHYDQVENSTRSNEPLEFFSGPSSVYSTKISIPFDSRAPSASAISTQKTLELVCGISSTYRYEPTSSGASSSSSSTSDFVFSSPSPTVKFIDHNSYFANVTTTPATATTDFKLMLSDINRQLRETKLSDSNKIAIERFERSSRVVYPGTTTVAQNINMQEYFQSEESRIATMCAHYIDDFITSQHIVDALSKFLNCYVKNSNLNRLQLVSYATQVPQFLLEKVFLKMNPSKICDKIDTFYSDTQNNGAGKKKWYYLGVSADVNTRVTNQVSNYKSDKTTILLDDLHHDMGLFVELTGILHYSRKLTFDNKNVFINESCGYDTVSYANKCEKKAGIYTFYSFVDPSTLKLQKIPQIAECEYINLNGPLCTGNLVAIAKESFEQYNNFHLRCSRCEFTAKLPVILQKHDLSVHTILNCECKGLACTMKGCLHAVSKHLQQSNCCDRALKATEISRCSFINVPLTFQSSLNEFIELCKLPSNTLNAMRRAYEKEAVERIGFNAKIHSIHNHDKVQLLCFIGDTENGLDSVKQLFYFFNAWMLMKVKACVKDPKCFIVSGEYYTPWKLDVGRNFVAIPAECCMVEDNCAMLIPGDLLWRTAFSIHSDYDRNNALAKSHYKNISLPI